MNLFSIFTAVFSVDLPEPVIADDDTALFVPIEDEPPQLRTQRIDMDAVLTLDQLHGRLAAYNIAGTGEWIVGHIRNTECTKYGRVSVRFEPCDQNQVAMWRDVSEIRYAYYE